METQTKILYKVQEKPYFIQNDFVLYHTNCLRILEQLPENSVDMVFADPPYFFLMAVLAFMLAAV